LPVSLGDEGCRVLIGEEHAARWQRLKFHFSDYVSKSLAVRKFQNDSPPERTPHHRHAVVAALYAAIAAIFSGV
jgi:hypothetical protein